ncbi:MAG TPA: Type 1 glutamine amidotransferase-like domain-containing protein [Candidatus Saccharibacteria bacterium]|nr:Type 1 glutamine amidotransferase-like domain-containing protein [Candidatus Saccharibacteria bacterium]
MGSIIIGGGGDKESSALLDAEYEKLVLDSSYNSSCLYIPHAMESSRHASAFEWFLGAYKFFSSAKLLQTKDDIDGDYDSIYMGGGYCHRLRDNLLELGIDNGYLSSFLQGGGVLYGGSAGGVVLGKSLVSSREVLRYPEVFMSLQHDGLDLCDGWSFRPHYLGTEEEDRSLDTLAQAYHIGIIALSEDSGLIFNGSGELNAINESNTRTIRS